jgi:hypothetical protein
MSMETQSIYEGAVACWDIVRISKRVVKNLFVSGSQISESGLAPGEEVDVAANLTAPEKPGRYVSHFRLATPQGVRYGHRMWALIHVSLCS